MISPGSTALVDSYGRTVRDLRISVTDRCNFRCTYCMPAEGLQWLDRAELLSYEEIERIARICVERFGFESFRLTGGEPLLRRNLEDLVGRLAALGADLAITTNGTGLVSHAVALRQAGLRRVNVSCDSLKRERFEQLTRRDELDKTLQGIDAALAAGFDPVKVNVVVIRGVNDDEIVDFAEFGRAKGLDIRFIEYMPLDADGTWSGDAVVPSSEVIAALEEKFPLVRDYPDGDPAPAHRWRYADGRGTVGVIASVTEPFCGDCDRIRITSDGQLRTCLFSLEETDLRGLMREGGSDDQLAEAIATAVAGKWAGHKIGQVNFLRPRRSMSQIGG
jgi:cyclic pyranopterin phosphate synthase